MNNNAVCNPRNGSRAFAILFAVISLGVSAPLAHATILVDEGFKTGSGIGYYSETDKTSLSNNETPTYTQSTGFAATKWQGTTGVIVSRTSGLSFPASFSGKMDAQGAGAIGYRGESGAVNWNDAKQTQAECYRNQYRKIVPLNGTAGDKRYFRALMCADANAISQLNTQDTWLSWRSGYSLGLAAVPSTAPSGFSLYNTSIMQCSRYMHFSFFRNGTGTANIAFTVKGTEDLAKRVTLCNITAGHTYLVVAEITLGDGPEQLRAFAYDCTADAGIDPENLPWVVADTSVTYTLFDGTDDLSLFMGGQYKTTGTVKFDEIRIGTTLADVIPVSDQYVTVSSAQVANLTTSSADLSVTVGMKGVSSATPSVAWGTTADALTHTNTLAAITEADTVTATLSGLDPMTTYYYQWTVAASGVDSATSPVDSFKTKGDVVFGDVTTGGRPSEGGVWASVGVVETGIGATTVTCWSGETAENMTAIGTWQNVQAGDTLVATNSAAVWGTTYLFKFVSTFEYNNNTYTTETPSGSVKPVALDFLKTTASGDWTDGANWSLGIPPNDVISAAISNVTTMASLYLEDKDVTVKSLRVKNGQAAVDLRGASSMTIGSITFGDKNIMNCDNGVLVTTGGVITVNGNVAPEWGARTSRNKLEFCGTTATINGSLSTATGNDSGGNNSVNVKLGSVLTITNGLTVSYTGTMVVDASTVTNKANLTVGNLAKQGTLTIRNGAYFRQPWATVVGVGGKGVGTLKVLNGSTFDASGAAFFLGSDGDGSWDAGQLLVTNSTFKASSFVSPRHTQFKGSYTIDVSGENALFNVTGNATLGCVNMTASSYGTSGSTRMTVDGGSVTVGGTLNVGGGEFDRRKDYLTVSGATATMNLGTLNCLTNAVVKFVVPESGFDNSAIISATNRIQLAEGMPPITVDATECKKCAWVSLLEAEKGITNLTAENLASRVVLVEKDGHLTKGDRPYEFRLVTDSSGESPIVTALKFRVGSMGLAIVIR